MCICVCVELKGRQMRPTARNVLRCKSTQNGGAFQHHFRGNSDYPFLCACFAANPSSLTRYAMSVLSVDFCLLFYAHRSVKSFNKEIKLKPSLLYSHFNTQTQRELLNPYQSNQHNLRCSSGCLLPKQRLKLATKQWQKS